MERSGIQDEIDYWTRELTLDGPYAQFTRRRLEPSGRVLEHPVWIDLIVDLLAQRVGNERPPRAVDLGCGPLGTLGHSHETGRLEVVGVDPLADVYVELRRRFAIDYPQPLVAAPAEQLASVVAPGSIDIVYSRNSLDHAEDVQLCFEQVAHVLRDGGVFCLEVFAWEGLRESYDGMHGFDFHVEGGALGCTDRAGREALDLSKSELVLVQLTPDSTPKPARAGADPITLRAVFVKSRDAELVARVADAADGGAERGCLEGWLDPAGPLAGRFANGWDAAVVRRLHPEWADAELGALHPSVTNRARVLEVGASFLPAFSWAALVGIADVRAFGAHANALGDVFDRHGIPARPVAALHGEALDVLRGEAPSSLDVVYMHDALWRANTPVELMSAAAAALAPGGLLLMEGPASISGSLSWRRPISVAVSVDQGRMSLARRGHTTAVTFDLDTLALELLHANSATHDDPLRGLVNVHRIVLRRRS